MGRRGGAGPGSVPVNEKFLGHYRIRERLGSGGMGDVYVADDLHLERAVAIKLLPADLQHDPVRLERFEREARALAALNHPSIVTIYSVERAENVRFMTMELVHGRNLGELIPSRGFALRDLLDIALPLTDALSAAHRRGVHHRDLKPANIMVTDDGRVKILDFGLARQVREVQPKASLHSADTLDMHEDGNVQGTVPYMAPEQVRGQETDERTDIYSLGVVLYEMATGERPFKGDTAADVISSILRDEPPPLSTLRPELPQRLERVVQLCLAKDRRRRLQSSLALRNDLEEIQRSSREAEAAVASIAVLPFVDMSPERDQEYFCEGIAEELIDHLAQFKGLRVSARTSSFQFKKAPLDIREIGRRLGVGAVLEGSVRKAGERLRITAQLVKIPEGHHLWSARYDRETQDVFAIQEEIARNIVHALQVTLTFEARRATRTTVVQAYEYYLRGRKFFYQYQRKGIEHALQMFSLAIKHDPLFALAYAGIADCHCFNHMYEGPSPESLRLADESSRKARELDPHLPEAYTSRGLALSLQKQHAEAEICFETAIRLGPNRFESYYLYARDCFAQGNLDKAVLLFEKASEVSPDDYQSPLLVGQVYADLGRVAEAEATRRRGVAIAERRLKVDPGDVRALYMGANGLVALGQIERGLEWAQLALDMEPDEAMVLYNIACIRTLAGQIEPALECLERAVDAGLRQRGWLEHDSNLDPLRTQPRFAALMLRLPTV